jgi:hypothetical protein
MTDTMQGGVEGLRGLADAWCKSDPTDIHGVPLRHVLDVASLQWLTADAVHRAMHPDCDGSYPVCDAPVYERIAGALRKAAAPHA